MPADLLTEVATDERRDKSTDVDAHVVDREAGVAAFTLVRIFVVEASDHGGDIGFEHSCADSDTGEPGPDCPGCRDGEHVVATGDNDRANEHSPARTPRAV